MEEPWKKGRNQPLKGLPNPFWEPLGPPKGEPNRPRNLYGFKKEIKWNLTLGVALAKPKELWNWGTKFLLKF